MDVGLARSSHGKILNSFFNCDDNIVIFLLYFVLCVLSRAFYHARVISCDNCIARNCSNATRFGKLTHEHDFIIYLLLFYDYNITLMII